MYWHRLRSISETRCEREECRCASSWWRRRRCSSDRKSRAAARISASPAAARPASCHVTRRDVTAAMTSLPVHDEQDVVLDSRRVAPTNASRRQSAFTGDMRHRHTPYFAFYRPKSFGFTVISIFFTIPSDCRLLTATSA